jgi:L-lactate permease
MRCSETYKSSRRASCISIPCSSQPPISPQNLTTGVSVTALQGQEGTVFRRTFPHSIVLTLALGVLVAIQQFLIPWIIPH